MSVARQVLGCALCWCACAALAACGEPPSEPSTELDVLVHDDNGSPLSRVPVAIEGVQVALTDARGHARALVHGSDVSKVEVSALCPSDYRKSERRSVSLGAHAAILSLSLACRPLLRTLAVVVRAPGAEGALVRADDEALGRIDAEGTLHALVKRRPESTLHLTIDTSHAPGLAPQHPTRDFAVLDRDDIVVFDQAFVVPPAQGPR